MGMGVSDLRWLGKGRGGGCKPHPTIVRVRSVEGPEMARRPLV